MYPVIRVPKEVQALIDDILIKEGNGKYTNDPKDSGGPTRWGVTEKVARENGYKGRMEDLPREFAFNLFVKKYWQKPGFELMYATFPVLAEVCLCFGVVAGTETAGIFVQRCLNVFNRNQRDYKDLKADGSYGTITEGALKSFIARRGHEGKEVFFGSVLSLMTNHFITLAERRVKDEEYVYGWVLNRGIGKAIKLGK